MYSCQNIACCLPLRLNTIKILQDKQYKRDTELFRPSCKLLHSSIFQVSLWGLSAPWECLRRHSWDASLWCWFDCYWSSIALLRPKPGLCQQTFTASLLKSGFVPLSVCNDTGSCSRIWLVFEKRWGLCGCRSAGSVKYVILFLKAK